MADDLPIIVVDLGGTNLRVGLVDGSGAIIERVREPSRDEDGPERVADRIVEAGRQLLAKHGFPKAMGLGAAIASPLDKHGVLYDPPQPAGLGRRSLSTDAGGTLRRAGPHRQRRDGGVSGVSTSSARAGE